VHAFVEAQGEHEPPQSTSVSFPFLVRSAQLAGWQRPLVQTPPTQSVDTAHPFAEAQGPQLPPQSTSVSVPSLTPSVQVGVAQICCTHASALPQSVGTTHPFPVAHATQAAPPQSTSDSSALFTLSTQCSGK